MKKSELRELVIKWKDLKRRSKNHDLSEEIKIVEHRYYHETGRRLEDELDKLEHELHKVEFNRPYDIVEIRKLKGKIQDLKNKNQESELSFGQV